MQGDVTWCFLHTVFQIVFQGVIFLNTGPFVKVAQHRTYKYTLFQSTVCAQNRLSITFLDTPFFLVPHLLFFPNLYLLKFPESLSIGFSEGPLGVAVFSDHTAFLSPLLESAMSLRFVIQSLAIS
jgi:hypothetical protein